MGQSSSKLPPLQTVPKCETSKFMGVWFVIAVKPTIFETTNSNAVETYTRVFVNNSNSNKQHSKHDIDIDFQYNKTNPITSPLKSLPQRGWIIPSESETKTSPTSPTTSIKSKEESSQWKVSPFGPIRFNYPIIELDSVNYSYCVIGHDARSYFWIMARKPYIEDNVYNMLLDKLKNVHLYDMKGVRKVPQVWTKKERKKRNLEKEIPDEFLVEE